MTDFRVRWGFLDHPKTIKLKRNLGPEAVLNLIRLYEFASRQRPRGILHNMDHEDIECASQWEGEQGKFVQWLLDLRLLDCDGEWCEIHDWEEHNPWAYYSEYRKEKAKFAAKKRWGNHKQKQQHNAGSNATGNAGSNAPSPSPSPSPLPNPSPNPKPSPKKSTKTYPPDSLAFKLAEFFLSEIKKTDGKAKPNLQTWARDMDYILRIDFRTESEIREAILFARKEKFEKDVILSPASLRKGFTRLVAKMEKAKPNGMDWEAFWKRMDEKEKEDGR